MLVLSCSVKFPKFVDEMCHVLADNPVFVNALQIPIGPPLFWYHRYVGDITRFDWLKLHFSWCLSWMFTGELHKFPSLRNIYEHFCWVKSTIFDDPIIQSQWFWLMSFIMVEECWTRLGKQITMFLSSTPDVCLSKSTIFTGKKPRKKVHESWLKSLGFKWKQKTTNKQKIRHLSWCSWPIPKFSWENQQKTPRASRPCAAFQVIQRPPRERSTRRMGTFESWSEHGQIPKT